MTLDFERIVIEKLYTGESNYNFTEGREGLLSLSKVLPNHLKINEIPGANSKLSLVDLNILVPMPNSDRLKSLTSVQGAPGLYAKQQQAKGDKLSKHKLSKTNQKRGSTTIMPIFKPVIERQISAEGHKRARRPYSAKTHRDRQHYAKVFLQNLVIKAQIQIANEISDIHVSKQQAARFWLQGKVSFAKRHAARQRKAKAFLLSMVKLEREELHKIILKEATSTKTAPGASTSIMTISMANLR